MTSFKPIAPAKERRPIAFITSANRDSITFETEAGEERCQGKTQAIMGLWRHIDHAIYSLVKPSELVECCGYTRWQIVKLRDRMVRLLFDGRITIYPLDISGSSPSELSVFFDRCWWYGVNASSFSTMAMRLWQRSLYKKANIKEWPGSEQKVGRISFKGGRKEAKGVPTALSGPAYLDLPAAYLQAMSEPLPQWIREAKADWYDSGIALATVTIPPPDNPDLWWGPLPCRIGKYRKTDLTTFGWGKDRGFWTLDELRQAKANGAGIELERVWKGYREERIFQQWLDIAYELRSLPGGAGRLAKHVTTRLWSLFGMNPDHVKILVSFTDDKNIRTQKSIPLKNSVRAGEHTTFLSSMIASRVRVRAAQEILSHPGCVYFDTDGGIVPIGTTIPGWEPKWKAELVEIRSSQGYRYRCSECGVNGGHPEWHYSLAGVKRDYKDKEGMFKFLSPDRILGFSYQSVCLPAGNIEEMRHSRPELEWSPLEGWGI